MTYMDLLNKVEELGIPCEHREWRNPPPLPYAVILATYNSDFMADNQNYKGVTNYQLEFYDDFKNPPAEKLIENMLNGLRLPYRKSEAFINSERLFQIVYQIQLIEE